MVKDTAAPFPHAVPTAAKVWAERIGVGYYEHYGQFTLTNQLGLTKTYHLFHAPACIETDIMRLCDLHAKIG